MDGNGETFVFWHLFLIIVPLDSSDGQANSKNSLGSGWVSVLSSLCTQGPRVLIYSYSNLDCLWLKD